MPLSRRSFLGLAPSAVALLCAARLDPAFGAAPAESPSAREMEDLIRKWSFFADEGWDAAPLHEAFRQGDLAGVTDCLRAFDRYAAYTSPREFTRMKQLEADHPAGVGMDIFEDRDKRVRCVPYPGSPAEIAGIRYRDMLESVDGQSVRGMALSDIAPGIRGTSGSTVLLAVRGEDGPPRVVVVERAAAEYPTVARTRISPPVLRIFRFARRTARDLDSCLDNLTDDEEGCVIDLRGNTGGNMEAGAACARLFLRKGETVLRLKRRASTKDFAAEENGKWADLPLSLVQDRFTASAAELFVAALKFARRARSHGTRSAGKACVQNLFTLSDGGVLKLTTEKLLYPGRDDDWEGLGIPPSPKEDSTLKGDIHA